MAILNAPASDLPTRAEELERRVLRLEAVARLGQDAISTHDLVELMHKAVQIVSRILNNEFCEVLQLLPSGDSLLLVSGVGWQAGHVGHATVPAGVESQAGYTLQNTEPVIVVDLSTETRFKVPRLLSDHGIVSGMSVIIPSGDRPFGVLGTYTRSQQVFTKDDVTFIQGIANVIAAFVQRQQLEDALRKSESDLRTVVSSDLIGMLRWTADGRVMDANNAFLNLVGYQRCDLEAGEMFWKTMTPEEYRAADEQAVEDLREMGRCTPYEKEFIRKDASRVPVLIGGVLLKGSISEGFAFVVDLTAIKSSEAAGYKLAAIIEGSEDAITSEDRSGKIVGWNPGAERLYGYWAEDVIGHSNSPHIPPDRFEEMRVLRSRVWQGERIPAFETVRRKKDGSRIDVLISISPIRDRGGNVVAISKIAHDITTLKSAEKELLLRDRAIRAVASGILITAPDQPDNPIIYASPGFERQTGYSPEEVVGKNCRFLQGKDTDPNVVAQIREAVREGKQCDVEFLNYRKDGTPFWNNLSISPVHSQTGRLTHFIGVQADVSERRRLEMQFQQAQKMEAVGRLAGGVAHDFNNLLMIINGYAELVIQSFTQDDPMRELLTEVIKAAERAGTLTRQLLLFSRQSVLEPRVFDINSVVMDTEKMLNRLIGEDITLTTALEPSLVPVKADPNQLQQALTNLAVNARDAMPQGGNLTIETHNVEITEEHCLGEPGLQPGRYSMIAVTDNGTGIDKETKARIFEPFFTTKEAGKGTGLGLAMVYGFVKSSGGHVSVYSEPGHGTTFKVYFPQVQERVSSGESLPGVTKISRGNETILVVEDEDCVRALIRHVLQHSGYNVLEASNGRDAVRLAQDHQGTIHLLVTDVIMPHMGGRQVAERLVEMRPSIKVLYCSGYTDDAVVRHGILEAGTSFVQKPYSPTFLAQKVRDVLDGRA
jgi:two-component system cell cycle sensor histidine kinase/response regulator CckA